MLARVLLAHDRPGPALTLQRLLDAAASQGRTGTTIEIQALAAPQPRHRHAAGPTAS